jgi:glutamine amidotransferase
MIGIINYDAGNTRSVQNTLERIGASYVLSNNKDELNACTKIIFPGVGSAGSAMKSLQERDLIDWIRQCKKPFLGICLGMQLLFESSEEGNTQCLGIMSGQVKKFKPTKKVPHMGWNQISSATFEDFNAAYFYFVHSYFVPLNQFAVARCHYADETFSSIVRNNNFWGMQFHPEKSGDIGHKLLFEFINNGYSNQIPTLANRRSDER